MIDVVHRCLYETLIGYMRAVEFEAFRQIGHSDIGKSACGDVRQCELIVDAVLRTGNGIAVLVGVCAR